MTPKAILDTAYKAGVVPPRLFGKTQHKTLHARLAEDILRRSLNSQFFRTDPGVFFLSELRSDDTIPNDYKDPFHARRRKRDLTKPLCLAISRNFLNTVSADEKSNNNLIKIADEQNAIKYVDPKEYGNDYCLVWAFCLVRKGQNVLSYRIGRYRDQAEVFENKRSTGFVDVVGAENASLFAEDFGISECSLEAVLEDLDLSRSAFGKAEEAAPPRFLFSFVAADGATNPVVVCVMEWICPDWFEPVSRRLSLNDVCWITSQRMPNNIDDFEPWSARALATVIQRAL